MLLGFGFVSFVEWRAGKDMQEGQQGEGWWQSSSLKSESIEEFVGEARGRVALGGDSRVELEE
jgi:hypothetical protein